MVEEEEEAEKEQTRSVEEELAAMEEKWKEQCAINETLKHRLANEEERFREYASPDDSRSQRRAPSSAPPSPDPFSLPDGPLSSPPPGAGSAAWPGSRRRRPSFLLLPGEQALSSGCPWCSATPCPTRRTPPPPPLVPRRPAELQFGNPYSTDGHAHAPDEQTSRPPPEAPLCAGPPAQASAPATPAATLEEEERQGQEGGAEEGTTGAVGGAGWVAAEVRQKAPGARGTGDTSNSGHSEVHKRCPLCEVIFPPHFEQRTFEQHVESHWKVCPVCAEQFPLNCQQQLFERHVLTHFDGHVLNFDQID
ncbi:hypothetical protein CRUP_022741 [Coryphaenoides rupestris]|nr:hypothetical protein CRUP_022741 [Coryphaenoides rupestris]